MSVDAGGSRRGRERISVRSYRLTSISISGSSKTDDQAPEFLHVGSLGVNRRRAPVPISAPAA